MFQTASDILVRHFGTQRHNHVPKASQSIDRVRGSRTLREVQSARHGGSSRLAADFHSLPRPLRHELETLAQRAEVLLMGRLEVWRLTNT